MHREILPDQFKQVNVPILSETPRVFTDQRHQAHHPGQPPPRERVVVQFVRLKWGVLSRVNLSITSRIKSAHGGIMDGDMVRMPVAADRVKCQHDLWSQLADIVGHLSSHLVDWS